MVENDFSEENTLVKEQMKRLAERLRFERRKHKISQMDLSFKAGMSQNMVSWIETGKTSPTVASIFKICNALGISPAVLFEAPDQERLHARETVLDLVSKYM